MRKIYREDFWNFKPEYFGPLLPLIEDDNITDINYNGEAVWIDDLSRGRYRSDLRLEPEFVNQFCARVANVVSANFNKFDNLVEAETDTLRVSIIHESAARTGHSVSIRKTPAIRRMSRESMIRSGYCSPEILSLLANCARGHMNMVFCGLPGSGKTELLKYLTRFVPPDEKVITVEDNLEIHYRDINPGSNCVELKVHPELFSYTKAIKAALRQNASWIMLSEARSSEVRYLLESLSTGLHGMTTLHTDDVRKIPDRVLNMTRDSYSAARIENDVYSFINVGALLRKKLTPDNKIHRYIDQVCFFDRAGGANTKTMVVEDGRMTGSDLPDNIKRKFRLYGVGDPFQKE